MTITVTTDVFCDGGGPGCIGWEQDATVTGRRVDSRLARQNAKRVGWSITRKGDFCPACAARRKEAADG